MIMTAYVLCSCHKMWQKPMMVIDHDDLCGWWSPVRVQVNLTIQLWVHERLREISLQMVVRHDLFGWQWLVKVQVAQLSCWHERLLILNHTLLRPNKGPLPPLYTLAIRSTNTRVLNYHLWFGRTHFTDNLCTGHLNFRICNQQSDSRGSQWNWPRLAKMPVRLLF